jgi:hypothetical protein
MALASMMHQLIEAPVPVQRDPRKAAGKAADTVEFPAITPYVAQFDLSQSLLEANQMKRPRRFVDVLIAIVLHAVVLGTPIFLSLWFTNTLDLRSYTQTMLVGPPPPPPPPPAPSVVKAAVASRRVFIDNGKLLAPSSIPKQVAMLKEAPLPDANGFGVEGGVPGGVPGGQMGGVIGGIPGGVGSTAPRRQHQSNRRLPYVSEAAFKRHDQFILQLPSSPLPEVRGSRDRCHLRDSR